MLDAFLHLQVVDSARVPVASDTEQVAWPESVLSQDDHVDVEASGGLDHILLIYICGILDVHTNEKFIYKFPKVFKFLKSFQYKFRESFQYFPKVSGSFQPIVTVSGKFPTISFSNFSTKSFSKVSESFQPKVSGKFPIGKVSVLESIQPIV